MSSGSTGTWSRNSSISFAVVPTTSGNVRERGPERRSSEEVAVDPRDGTASCRPCRAPRSPFAPARRASRRSAGGAARRRRRPRPRRRTAPPTHSASGCVERSCRRAALRRSRPRRATRLGRREQVGERPAPADSPISTIRSGSPPKAGATSRTHATAASEVAQTEVRRARRRRRASRAPRGDSCTPTTTVDSDASRLPSYVGSDAPPIR